VLLGIALGLALAAYKGFRRLPADTDRLVAEGV